MSRQSSMTGELIAQKYRVMSLLGEGGMGVVLLAVHEPLGAMVAVKILSSAGRTLPDEKRFLFEAQAAAQLKSPYVAHVTDFGTLDDGRQYMVMEHLEGEDLAARLQRGRIPVSEACDFLIQTCAGLAEAHASGIIHRDIKPSNLFVTRTSDGSESIKVLDFGVSKFQLGEGGYHALTATGLAVGTPLYMSPEQVHGSKTMDARSDIWSLGVVLYELCTGKTPFYDESLGVTLLNVLEKPHPTLRNSGVELGDHLERVVDACLSKDPAGRPDSVAEVAASLARFASPEGRRLAERVPAIAKRASSRVHVSLPPTAAREGGGDQTTVRVATSPNPSSDSGPVSRGGETPQPTGRTGHVPLSRSRFTVLVLLGLAVLVVVTTAFWRSRPSPVTVATSEPTPSSPKPPVVAPSSQPIAVDPASATPASSATPRPAATHVPQIPKSSVSSPPTTTSEPRTLY